MKWSEYYLCTLKNPPADTEIKSHKLSIQAGLIKKVSSGVYSWLPSGFKVMKNIMDIVTEHMDEIGAMHINMPSIQPASLWQESGRYDSYGKEMMTFKDRHNKDFLLGPTHEELISDLLKNIPEDKSINNIVMYQINSKFRDEIRPRFGVMRAREFIMKDAYSFDDTEENALLKYNTIYNTYFKIFHSMELPVIAAQADTGAIGGQNSHEFNVISDIGESTIYYDKNWDNLDANDYKSEELQNIYAATDDMHDISKTSLPEDQISSARSTEIGHIFYLGQKYSKAMSLKLFNKQRVQDFPYMGCYGIGISRLVAAIIENSHDERGIIWPKSVAPFQIGIINLDENDDNCNNIANQMYNSLKKYALYDDRPKLRAGNRFADMDLIGLPWQIIIGKRNLEKNQIELKERKTSERRYLNIDQVTNFLLDNIHKK